MSILHKFNELDHLVLTVPVEGGGCSTCLLHDGELGCTKAYEEVCCDTIMKEPDGADLYVFKELVGR